MLSSQALDNVTDNVQAADAEDVGRAEDLAK